MNRLLVRDARLDARIADVGEVVAGPGDVGAVPSLEGPEDGGECHPNEHVQHKRRQPDVTSVLIPGTTARALAKGRVVHWVQYP